MTTRKFAVLLGNRERVQSALEMLAKRATRKGLTPLTWTWGKASTKEEAVPHPEYGWDIECRAKVARIPLTIMGDAPHYAGWTFVAALQHLDGENIVRTLPDKTIPETYRTRGPVCDHCRANRRRNDTYVLRHTDGRIIQVGSTCVGDFLGSDDAGNLAAAASMLAAARGIAEEGCEGFGRDSGDVTLGSFLAFVAWEIRTYGWISRTAARESGGSGTRATADVAWRYLTNKEAREDAKAEPTEEDTKLAADAEAWAESLTGAAIDAERGDYLHNLRAIARSGIVALKSAGLAASTVIAYQRATARERERALRAARPTLNEYVGTPKKRETWTVTLDFVTGYESDFGYVTVLKFRTPEGALLVWKTGSDGGGIERSDVGKAYHLTGTVSKHTEYKGEKQTVLSRCIVRDANPNVALAS